MIKDTRAYQYAKWCVRKNNDKAPCYVKKQAKAWLDVVAKKNKEAYFDTEEYEKVYGLLGLIQHPDLKCSMAEGLEDYAHLLITAVLCTKLKNKQGEDIRYYSNVVLEIARKNFKTFTSGVIFILLLLTAPDFARLFSVAPDLKLSQELQLAVKRIVKASPLLEQNGKSVFTLLRSEIRCGINDNTYIPLAYSRDNMDAKTVTAFLADEAGNLDEYPIEAMRSGQITLKNKLGIIISTQYPNDDNAFLDEIDLAKKVLDGLVENKRTFALLYEPDERLRKKDLWKTDDTVIYQANPVAVNNTDVFQNIKEKRELAVLYENKRENFLCKHCNIKYKGLGVEGYIDLNKVRECKKEEDLRFWEGKRVFLGLDLSQSDDNTALAMVCADEEGIIHAKVFGFIPEDRIEEKSLREKVNYKKLIREGCCFACGNEVIDYGFVEDFALSLMEAYGVEIVNLGYDKWNALSTIQKLESSEQAIECVEIRQHSSVLHSPTKLLKERVLSGTFRYDENLLLEINFSNARCTEDTNKNKYVNKKRSSGKVDMVVALINAMYLLEQEMLYGMDFVIQTT